MSGPSVEALADLLAPLNEQQRAVVSAPMGEVRLVLAGPGSGKTRTLVHRVAYMLSQGVPPERILLVTFTNKAAREMMGRCEALCGPAAWRVVGGTFHGLAAQLLRRYGAALGLDPAFRILDRSDTEDQLRAAVADAGLDVRRDGLPRVRTLGRLFSMAVQREMGLEQALLERWPQHHHNLAKIEQIGARFVARKQEAGHVDFDDLLVGWSLLANPPDGAEPSLLEASAALCGQFVEILVDEYQDTNAIQGRIAESMARVAGGLTVVGDDCQGIYGFRGADAKNLLGFSDRFAAAEQGLLSMNYRSTPEILNLANQSIAFNTSRLDKELQAVRPSLGLPPWVVPLADREEEARFVVTRVAQLHGEGVPLNHMAVLYRTHGQSTELQVALGKAGLPYVVRSGVRFFEQAHIKDLFAFWRALEGDPLALRRVLLLFPGVGTKGAERAVMGVASGAFGLADLGAGVGGATGRGLRAAGALFAALAANPNASPASQLEILIPRYREQFLGRFDDAPERSEDLDDLQSFAEAFESPAQLLADLPVAHHAVGAGTEQDALVLSSIHQAKGLEWARVFVVGLIEGQLPHAASFSEPLGVEEERRLFYVAITRAADELTITYVQRAGGGRLHAPSRFLVELSEADPPPFVLARPAFEAAV